MKKTWPAVAVAIVLVILAQARIRRADRSGGAAASAIGSLSAIARAQSEYAQKAGSGGYAASVKTLATPCTGRADVFLPPDLGFDPTTKSGYEIRMRAKASARQVAFDCNGVATVSGYYATATPAEANQPAFAVDEAGTVWSDSRGVPPSPPFREHGSVKAVR